MKLSQWAKSQGIHYNTAYRWFRTGNMPVQCTQVPSGAILVQENQTVKDKVKKVSIYARVSSHDKKEDLKRQVERCQEFCRINGFAIKEVVSEIASGMNDKRPKLIKLLNSSPEFILVENKDRLTRFGFNYLDQLLPKMNCELVVMNPNDNEENELKKDMMSAITRLCCRLYGLRKGKNKVKTIKKELEC